MTGFDLDRLIEWGKLVGTFAGLYLAIIWLSVTFWTYRDIRRRSRSYAVQAIATLFVLASFLPGLWVYLILRPRLTLTQQFVNALEQEALLQELDTVSSCPECRRPVRDDYLLCPACKTALKDPCVTCMKPMARAWVACAYCGADRPALEPALEAVPAAAAATGPAIAGRKLPAFPSQQSA